MKISFKNYKSFSKKSQFNIGKFNIFIGKNSSGKTALSEIVGHHVNLITSEFRDPNKIIFNELSRSKPIQIPAGLKEKGIRDIGFSIFRNSDDIEFLKYIYPPLSSYHDDEFKERIHFEYNLMIKRNKDFEVSNYENLKPIKFSKIREYNHPVFNKIEQYSDLIFNEWIKIKKDKFLKSTLDVMYGQKDVEHLLKSNYKFLDGLTIIQDKESNRFFATHKDGTFIKNLMRNLSEKILPDIFEKEIRSVLLKFMRSSDKISRNFEILPKSLSYENSKTNFAMISKLMNEIDEKMFFSPYLNLDFNYAPLRRKNKNLISHPIDYFEHFVNQMFFEADSLLQELGGHNKDNFMAEFKKLLDKQFNNKVKKEDVTNRKNKLSDFEFRNLKRHNKQFLENDYYKDFNIVPFISEKGISSKTRHNQIRKDGYNRKRGFLFEVSTPYNTELHVSNLSENKPSKSTKSDVFEFLDEVGLSAVVSKYFKKSGPEFEFDQKNIYKKLGIEKTIVNEVTDNSIHISLERAKKLDPNLAGKLELGDTFVEYNKSYLANAALYTNNFADLFYNYNSELESLNIESKIDKASKKYNVPKIAIEHQINVIRYFLLTSSVVQFYKTFSKYLFLDYKVRLAEIDVDLIVGDIDKAFNLHNVHIIKPQILNRDQKDKNVFSFEELDSLFNNGFSYLFKNFTSQDLTVEEKDVLKKFVDDINQELKKLKLDFEIVMEHQTFKDPTFKDSNNKSVSFKTFDFILMIKLSKPDIILPLNQCGMGHTIILSVIASIYFAKLKQDEELSIEFPRRKYQQEAFIIIREPETHLHPRLIEQLIEYLFNMTFNNKNINIIIETHSEVILRQTQYLTKMLHKKDNNKSKKSDKVKVLYVNKRTKYVKTPHSIVNDLGIKENGFLTKKVPDEFFDTNTNLISKLWRKP